MSFLADGSRPKLWASTDNFEISSFLWRRKVTEFFRNTLSLLVRIYWKAEYSILLIMDVITVFYLSNSFIMKAWPKLDSKFFESMILILNFLFLDLLIFCALRTSNWKSWNLNRNSTHSNNLYSFCGWIFEMILWKSLQFLYLKNDINLSFEIFKTNKNMLRKRNLSLGVKNWWNYFRIWIIWHEGKLTFTDIMSHY